MEYNPSTDGLFFAETFQGQDPFTSVRACVRAADIPPPFGSHLTPHSMSQGRVVKSDADKYVHQMLKIDVPSLFSGIAGDKVRGAPRRAPQLQPALV